MAGTRRIEVRVDDALYGRIAALGAQRGDGSTSETVRFLLEDAVLHNTEAPYASHTAQAVRDELGPFLDALDGRMGEQLDDLAREVSLSLAGRAEEALLVSRAALYASCAAAGGQAGGEVLRAALAAAEEDWALPAEDAGRAESAAAPRPALEALFEVAGDAWAAEDGDWEEDD